MNGLLLTREEAVALVVGWLMFAADEMGAEEGPVQEKAIISGCISALVVLGVTGPEIECAVNKQGSVPS